MNADATETAIGWFTLSEADRAAASRHLAKLASDGTRDELGFAPIHFAFADRFFPGTSVQHAQLRYVLFVAWTYQELLEADPGARFNEEALREIERRYSRRLMDTAPQLPNSGISGWMKYEGGTLPAVRASTIYWSALRSWGLVRSPITGEPPSEAELRNAWPRLVMRAETDGGKTAAIDIFEGIPKRPADWARKSGPLDFALTPAESRFLQARWRTAGPGGSQPLMSKVADAGVHAGHLWSKAVRRLADERERASLDIARRAASMACIARAAHAALIEARRNQDLGRDDARHREALPKLVEDHRAAALELDVEALRVETGMDHRLTTFIEGIKSWTADAGPLAAIEDTIVRREHELKTGRAYLSNERRRVDWSKGVAEPLESAHCGP
jgi:hypothetical protein